MARKYPKVQKISPMVQLMQIRTTYRNIESSSYGPQRFECILNIRPSENSDQYRVKVKYRMGKYPEAWLLSPAIQQYDGKYPHHIYEYDSEHHPRLCVFFPDYKEWTGTMLISKTFIPWISTWLNAYEYWQITGVWHYDESPRRKKQSEVHSKAAV